MKVIENL